MVGHDGELTILASLKVSLCVIIMWWSGVWDFLRLLREVW